MATRFTSTLLFMWGGLLIWVGDFLAVYIFTALACIHFSSLIVAGWPIVPLVVTCVSIVAFTTVATLMVRAVRRLRLGRLAEAEKFTAFIAVALDGLALIAIVWTAFSPLAMWGNCAPSPTALLDQ